MAVDTTELMREVDAIAAYGEGSGNYQLQVQIKVGDSWLTPARIELYALERDYEEGYGDHTVLEVTMGQGEYAYKLVPHRDQLWVDVTLIPLVTGMAEDRTDVPRQRTRYRAVLIEQDNPALVGRSPQASSAADLDLTGLKTVQLQLIDDGLYQARMMSVGNNYRQTTPMNVLRAVLTETSQLLDVNQQQQIFGVDVAEGYNQTVRQQIVVPHGISLTELPTFLQLKEGGLYSTGVGCYLQRGFWYVYPLYDLTRWQRTPKVLTILNVPANRVLGAERSFRKSSQQVVIVAAGNMQSVDPGQHRKLNAGSGVRFTDANRLLNFDTTKNNITEVHRHRNITEVAAGELRDGLHYIRWAEERATSNPFKYYSQLAQQAGQYVTVEWMFGDADLLYPGMPVKFITNADGKLLTLAGVLLGVHEQRVAREAGINPSQFPANVTLKLFLARTDQV